MKCELFLAQFGQPTPAQFWGFLLSVLFCAAMVALYYKIKADRRSANASDEPKRTILPMPLLTKPATEFVTVGDFAAQVLRRDKELKDMEGRLERRIDAHENLVRDRLHKISNEVQGATSEAKNGRELATEQFQNIEGRLGEVKSSLQHMVRTQDRVDRNLENLPETIAKAIERAKAPRR
jgi:hypothetical protein